MKQKTLKQVLWKQHEPILNQSSTRKTSWTSRADSALEWNVPALVSAPAEKQDRKPVWLGYNRGWGFAFVVSILLAGEVYYTGKKKHRSVRMKSGCLVIVRESLDQLGL